MKAQNIIGLLLQAGDDLWDTLPTISFSNFSGYRGILGAQELPMVVEIHMDVATKMAHLLEALAS